MHGRPAHHDSDAPVGESHPQRWQILGVLVLALLVTSVDHTIINVALPEMVSDLDASAASLQWIVAAYTVVFAGLLLTAGSLGDRFGRRHALAAGLVTFMTGSVLSALAGTTTMLIAGRGVMGLGGALIMPTTLSVLVNAFGDPRERAHAIALWTAVAGAGIALGPIAGGYLMRDHSWSSVFWINVPLLAIALIGALHVVPDSKDPHATRLDPVGAVASTIAIGALVYAIIDAPESGWTSPSTLMMFMAAAMAGAMFVRWELRRDEPMLDMRLFANRSFSAGSVALAMLFFAMAGTVFLQAQYLQFVLSYTPLAAGVALVPAAVGMMLGTGVGAHVAGQLGGRVAVTTGTLVAGAGVAIQATFVDGTSYLPTGVGLALFGLGAGMAMPAATELIMSTLPPARAGVGSAVNDTVREIGGALGVAVIGSVAASTYASNLNGQVDHLPTEVQAVVTDNVGAALTVSSHLGADGTQLADAAREAFVTSMTSSLWVGVALAAVATVIAWTRLPKPAGAHAHGAHGHAVHHGHVVHGHAAHGDVAHTHHDPQPTATVAIDEAALSAIAGPS